VQLLITSWNQQLILDNQDELANLMTLEQGKPLAEAKGSRLWRVLY